MNSLGISAFRLAKAVKDREISAVEALDSSLERIVEHDGKIQALLTALKTDAVKQYIADTYAGAVVAIF